jgi:hypothetical protein
VRVDERSIIARTDRNHPSHQPFAVDPTPPSPTPDLSTWFDPVNQSYAEMDVWTVDRPLPNALTVLLLGSGDEREGDTAWWLVQESNGQVRGVRIDTCIGGYGHDWTIPDVHARLLEWIECPLVIAIAYAFDCSGWAALRCIQPGPKPLFNSDYLSGIPLENGEMQPGVLAVRPSYDAGVLLLRAAHRLSKPASRLWAAVAVLASLSTKLFMQSMCRPGRTHRSLRSWLRMALSLSIPTREQQERPRARQWSGRSQAASWQQHARILGR